MSSLKILFQNDLSPALDIAGNPLSYTEDTVILINKLPVKITVTWQDGFACRISMEKLADKETINPLTTTTSIFTRALKRFIDKQDHLLNIPIRFYTTSFRKRVYRAVMNIPTGQTKTYSDISSVAGGSPRAVGQALNANPLPLAIPCHRVIGKSNKLVGFSCGLSIKAELLSLEQ